MGETPKIQILYISNIGGGANHHIDIDAGTTVEQLFVDRVPNFATDRYKIRVTRNDTLLASNDLLREVLQPDDMISIMPIKIDGALVHLAA
jgi:hypothetical protein